MAKTRTRRRRQEKQGKQGRHEAAKKSLVATFLQMLLTVKIYHWNTTSFAQHKATDELYADLNEKIDKFIEVLLGKPDVSRQSVLSNLAVKATLFRDSVSLKNEIEGYKTFLLGLSSRFPDAKDTDLINVRDDLLTIMNQFLYLLTLK